MTALLISVLHRTLGAAMRHAMGLLSEPSETFLKVLAFYEKVGVIESVAAWQTCRSARNLAAHSYETDYQAIAEHFNTLCEMQPILYRASREFVSSPCAQAGLRKSAQPLNSDYAPR